SPAADEVERPPANGRKSGSAAAGRRDAPLRGMRRRFPARPPTVALLQSGLPVARVSRTCRA
ncbi:MAG TPA: hypothetical protein VNZ53_10865, partial [Steroidobacteraceae bacterium]|nr:hypothetical protein [Steroidobacteraceae bacterium]